MRSNRSNYAATPAGSAKALDQKPKPKRSKREWNQLMLMLFFLVLPVLGLLAILFQPVRWLFMLAVVAGLALMWMSRAFLFPGRMILSAIYGLLLVFTLVTALSAKNTVPVYQPPTLVPTAEPTPMFSYSMMGTSVPAGHYDDSPEVPDDLSEVNIAGGSVDQSGQDLGLYSGDVGVYAPTVKSDAEIALENFMEKWRRGVIADMVDYTAPSWQSSLQDPPQQQLFWKFAQRPLQEWRQMSAPTGTDASNARTITIQADVNYSGEMRTYEYSAIMLCENGTWYVDPDSLSSGILQQKAAPTPDPNMTPTPSPVPTPTPTPGAKTKLYYNKNGGKMYHADPECYTVDKSYLPLKSFNYGDLNKSPYNKLKPCDKCGAPARP